MKIPNKIKDKMPKMNGVKNAKDKFKTTKDNIKSDINKLTLAGVIDDVINNIMLAFKYSLNDITLIPGRQLKEPLQICAGITFISLVCDVLKLPCLLDWKGSLIGLTVLAILVYFGEK